MLRVIAVTGLLIAATPGVARGVVWRWPVDGRVVGLFSLSPDAPYAAGQHRGITIAAPPGAPVLSACAGRVAFAGPVGHAGPTVSVVCGALRATYQGLATITTSRGDFVRVGAGLARLAGAGRLKLGARVQATGAYIDPATLLARSRPPLGPAPVARRVPRRSPPVPVAAPPHRFPVATRIDTPARAPLPAWLGAALAALAVPVGALHRARGRVDRRRRAAAAAR